MLDGLVIEEMKSKNDTLEDIILLKLDIKDMEEKGIPQKGDPNYEFYVQIKNRLEALETAYEHQKSTSARVREIYGVQPTKLLTKYPTENASTAAIPPINIV